MGQHPGGVVTFEELSAAAARTAAHFRVVADGLEAAASVYPVWSVATWSGLAAFEALRLTERQPARFRTVAEAFRVAAEALSAHAARLHVAASVEAAAGRAPVAAAPGLRAHAEHLASFSTSELAARLQALAARAPAEPSFPARVGHRLAAWHDEAAVGAGESTASLIGLVARSAGVLRGALSSRTVREARCGVAGLRSLAGHPGSTFKALVDWDTWATNPPRAAGRLVPDLIGGAGGARAARVAAASEHAALRAAAARRLADEEAAALAARERLRSAALGAPAVVERFHELSMAAEARLTTMLVRVARDAGADLVGLPTRRKALESALRKAALTKGPIEARLDELDDLVRYTVVVGEPSYSTVVGQVGRVLWENGFRPARSKNFWASPKRYRGINSWWIDPAHGVVFEVQFHTPATWRAGRLTHPLYEEMRDLEDQAARAPLEARIKAEYDKAPVPPAATSWTKANYPPRPAWLTPLPVDPHATTWATAGAATPALATAADHRGGP